MNLTDFDPLEKLKLLEPSAKELRPLPPGHMRETGIDIAGRLARLSRGASLFVRVKYAGQYNFDHDLRHWLKVEVFDDLVKSTMQIHADLCDTAITEALDDRVCRVCLGVGNLPEVAESGKLTGKNVLCPENCDNGRVYWTDYARAKCCHMHHETWKRHHGRLYMQILTIPLTWEGEARRALIA